MKNGGSITFTSGTAVVRPSPGNIRINTIAPGLIDTELFDVMNTPFWNCYSFLSLLAVRIKLEGRHF